MILFPSGSEVIVLYHVETGERVERAPVDAREMLAGGLYTLTPGAPSVSTDVALVEGMSQSGAAVLVAAGYPTTASLRALSLEEADRIEGLSPSDVAALHRWIAGGSARRLADPAARGKAAEVKAATAVTPAAAPPAAGGKR